MKEEKKLISCSFYNKCENYQVKCKDCRWNAQVNLGDFLILKTKEGKTVRFL